MMYRLIGVIGFLFLLYTQAKSQDIMQDSSIVQVLEPTMMDSVFVDLMESSLEQTVTSTSLSEQKVTEAAGIVQVLTRSEIMSYGGISLVDILQRLTGAMVSGSFRFQNNGVALRGNLVNEYTTDVLILINGRPCREMLYGGMDLSVINSFPVDNIERIEVIRGPGSAFYGVNAFTGVINIVTVLSEKSLSVAEITRGSGGTGVIGVRQNFSRNRLNMSMGFRYCEQDGSPISFLDPKGDEINIPHQNQSYGFVGKFDYGKFTFNSYWGTTMREIASAVTPADSMYQSNLYAHRSFYDLGYKTSLMKNWNMRINNMYSYSKLRGNIYSTGNELDSKSNTVEMIHEIKLRKRTSLSAGMYVMHFKNYEENVSENESSLLSTEGIEKYVGVFSQLDFYLTKRMRLNFSLQYNYSDEFSIITPRLTLLHTLSEKSGIKINSCTATKPLAEFVERASIFTLPEKVLASIHSNLDISFFKQGKKAYVSVDAFFSNYFNVTAIQVGRTPDNTTTLFADSHTDMRYYGLEYEFKWEPTKYMSFIMNGLLFNNQQFHRRESEWVKNVSMTPRQMLKGGFHLGNRHNSLGLGVFMQYYGKMPNVINSQSDLPIDSEFRAKNINPSNNSFTNLTLSLNLNLRNLILKKDLPDAELRIFADNLLDQLYWQPEMVYKRINTTPSGITNGRSINMSLLLKIR